MNTHIKLLGGGLLGRLMALALKRQGYALDLYDQGTAAGESAAAYIAAAMLAPTAEATDATAAVLALGHQSLPLWRDWIASLQQPVFMQQMGSLIVWHPQDKALATRFCDQVRHGHHGQEPWQLWQKTAIAQAEPELAERFSQGLYLPTEGQLDNRQLLDALAHQLKQEGVVCHWQTAMTWQTTPRQTQDWLIDCRGFGAKEAWNQQGATPLRGIRGEVARIIAPEVTLNRPVRLLHPRYPLYIAPKQNHLFVIGATQLESEDNTNIAVRSVLELMSALYAVHPAFGEGRVEGYFTGLRPTLAHHDPEILVDVQQKIMAINGLYRHGFMIAPAVVAAALAVFEAVTAGENPETINQIKVRYV